MMITQTTSQDLEKSIGTLLTPIDPNPDFIYRLQKRLENPNRVELELPEKPDKYLWALGGTIALLSIVIGIIIFLFRRVMAR